jgi:nucleotide-binding universal stress UspA family protein
MFEKILVPLDGSTLAECVLPHVVAMSRSLGAKVTLVNVCRPSAGDEETGAINAMSWHFRTAEADAYLENISGQLAEAGLDVGVRRLDGKPAEQILAFADQSHSDLIALSSHGRSGLTGWNVSSVVQKIIARARVSLLIVRAYRPVAPQLSGLTYSRLLCPLDCSQRAEHPLPLASMLARSHGATLILAHVVRRPEMPRRRPLSDEEREARERVVDLNRTEAGRYLDELRSAMAAEQVDVQTRLLLSEEPAQTLHDLVKEEQVDLVVMSAHGYTGSTSSTYGSLALSFLVQGTTPLLIAQDLPPDEIGPTEAESLAHERTGH